MTTGTFSKIFNQLVADGKISVKTSTKQEHENLRTRLVKHFSYHKETMVALGVEDDQHSFSVCASFETSTGISVFRLGVRKGGIARETKEFEIIVDAQEKAA